MRKRRLRSEVGGGPVRRALCGQVPAVPHRRPFEAVVPQRPREATVPRRRPGFYKEFKNGKN
jgi:hypothetical protein